MEYLQLWPASARAMRSVELVYRDIKKEGISMAFRKTLLGVVSLCVIVGVHQVSHSAPKKPKEAVAAENLDFSALVLNIAKNDLAVAAIGYEPAS